MSTMPEVTIPARALVPLDGRDARAFRQLGLHDPIVVPVELGGLISIGPVGRAAKRAVDIVGAVVGLVLATPVLLLAAILVVLTSPGPVLYRQERVGRRGEAFQMLKLRSMYHDADARLATLAGDNEADGPVFKMRHDPRITPVGRVLRKSSADELPQLWNVLRGQLSLVGPRPPLAAEVAAYGMRERQRLLVTPGLTCIWQVSGRSDVEFATWVEMDLDYIRNWSLWLDVKLIALTVPAVLTGRGAY